VGRPAIMTDKPVALPEHELLSRIFRTLGDATRLRLLEALEDMGGEVTQTALVRSVGATQSRTSEHLSCLAWCGLVTRRRDGRTVRYRLADHRARAFLQLAREFLDDNQHAVGHCTILRHEDAQEAPPVVPAAPQVAPVG
jgi:DNA-binding transcriptional ArsR family regulator